MIKRNSKSNLKGVFIDRDGTINEDRGYIFRIEDFRFIPGSLSALKKLTEAGVHIHIITNQSGIAMGHYTEEDYFNLTHFMLNEFERHQIKVSDVVHCPHHAEGTVLRYQKVCKCRKPETGLIDPIIEREGYLPHHLAVIGDKNSDIEAGRRLGIRSYLVETGFGADHRKTT
ncbi:MAG: HAD family hydrolase, partial [bacterium]|nr:HAD family hydrolase [bacterium]